MPASLASLHLPAQICLLRDWSACECVRLAGAVESGLVARSTYEFMGRDLGHATVLAKCFECAELAPAFADVPQPKNCREAGRTPNALRGSETVIGILARLQTCRSRRSVSITNAQFSILNSQSERNGIEYRISIHRLLAIEVSEPGFVDLFGWKDGRQKREQAPALPNPFAFQRSFGGVCACVVLPFLFTHNSGTNKKGPDFSGPRVKNVDYLVMVLLDRRLPVHPQSRG